MEGFDPELPPPKPTLARFLEAIAAIVDVRDGRLELIFRDGRLQAWTVNGGLRVASDLATYDDEADQLVARTRLASR
jgi:hypothetical protein